MRVSRSLPTIEALWLRLGHVSGCDTPQRAAKLRHPSSCAVCQFDAQKGVRCRLCDGLDPAGSSPVIPLPNVPSFGTPAMLITESASCLLYTSDAADDLTRVD